MNQEMNLKDILSKQFNYSSFHLGQEEIIRDILKGNDVLGVLPTGSGKSLCYQLPAKILNGVTIVVSPLISLMIDQVKQLKAMNYKGVVALNSFMEYKERRRVYQNLSSYQIIYISPELLQQKHILRYFSQIKISLFVIDEAHCISQWGHEFRPDYLKLDTVIKKLKNPPVLALSATVTASVQEDIISSLDRPGIKKHVYPIDRKNITLCVQEVSKDYEKIDSIVDILSSFKVPTLIYFSSRKSTEEVKQILSKKLPNHRIAFYHGDLDQMDRITIQQQFMNDQLDVICCTSAFGMGINKRNIRLIIHYHFSLQIESYIQEVGRAGRDGDSSISLLLYSRSDKNLPKALIQQELPTENEIKYSFQQLYRLYKNGQSIPTTEKELSELFQITQIQWRFLHYQFEFNGIIKDNHIVYDEKDWKKSYVKIIKHQKKRLSLKEAKLEEMIKWINHKECLRKELYKSFQSSYSQATHQCCNNCGFSWLKWRPVQTTVEKPQGETWENKLKELLLVGEDHEAK